MSDIAVINHSDCKIVYAWATHRSVVAMFDLESDAPHCECVARLTITKPNLGLIIRLSV